MRKMLRSSLMQRILWTILILFIYMLGKYTPISTYPHQLSQNQTALAMTLNSFAMVTGGEFSKLNLFSLGLSPWMTSMILWRFVGFLKLNAAFTQLQNHLSQTFIMLIVGLIQAFGYLAIMPAASVSTYERLGTIVILLAGTFVLMWLGNLNTEKGLGGSSTIIAASMILSFIMSVSAMTDSRLANPIVIVLFVLAALVLVWIAVLVYKAEYRIPTRRIMLNTNLLKSSYIPIRVTPAGGMPFMYAMTLMTLPVLLLQGLIAVVPQLAGLRGMEGSLSVSELPGILLYTGVLFILSYGFAYFNMDPSEVAENMQKSGDYIENIRPGKATQAYLTRYLNRMAFVGAVYTCMMGSLPLFLVWYFNGETGLGMMVNNIYIVTTLMLTIVEQVDIIQSWKQYEDII
ncbi:accessory Sec system protein translocase subunit SecY2 [Streptococcus suis]|uniref:accessory Sec system protein translocase subunit SecY2 n=1 Tax=Streptococcus suis TaxID=1307 RepID=UPI001ABDFF32|nr:accessory Sec system protein translocase subunit SecY2 [Streptococcus suis]